MDNENKGINYLDKIQQYFETHSWKMVGVALGVVILAISFSGFLELLKTVFSPQIVICGLVLYFLVTFKAEIARLIDRIKEANAWGVGIKTDGPVPTPKDKENIPEPEMKVSASQKDLQNQVGMADLGRCEPLSEGLIRANQQANYWFFKYLFSELTPAAIWLLKVIARRPMHSLDFDLQKLGYGVSPEDIVGKNGARLWKILTGFGLIRIGEGESDITDLGDSFLDFYDKHRVPNLQDAAVAFQRKTTATEETTTK